MKNLVIINAVNLSEYAYKKLSSGKTSIDLVFEYSVNLSDVEKIVILASSESENIEKLLEEKKSSTEIKTDLKKSDLWNSSFLFEVFEEEGRGFDNIFYVYGDSPFLDNDASERIYRNHLEYQVQYSFGDGGPYGILPEIISHEIAGALKVLADKSPDPVERDTVFKTIQKDINSFDIETDISDTDLRLFRISLTADSLRNIMLVENFIKEESKSEKDIFKTAQNSQEILRTLPAYFIIQITDRCFQSCSYCPYPVINPFNTSGSSYMDPEKYNEILCRIKDFCDDAVISLSLWGEPSAHPDIESIIEKTLSFDKFRLIIETSGIGWKSSILEKTALLNDKVKERLFWIISLDADTEEVYKKLRGEGFEEAFETAENLNKLFGKNCYFQSVRMGENEEILENFYKKCRDSSKNIIIQKYDSFCGFLPERKVTDISPLKRIPCWHLKRDLSILLDGTVPLCKEDVKSEIILGNVFTDPIEKIWDNGKKYYFDHIKSEYNGICRNCDEYYTYNF